MALKLFNTLTRSLSDFVPLDPARKKVGMYCCGPTVHDLAHIGNFRTFVFADLLRRYLEFKGYTVEHVLNITDVEDKIIKRVRESGLSLAEYTGKYEGIFFEDSKMLGCLPPHHTPHATAHIPQIIALIARLIARGVAYQAPDRSVYFSIAKYRACGCHYGQLAKLNFEEMRPGERVSQDEYEKESLADFALWKARVADDGDVFWPSPWGDGRPGWHIECSAMSLAILGENFDLHLGGEDLIFPHHEDEIAQSEGATGRPFVKYWMHGAHLLVEGKKMSKSLGNYFTVRDLLERGFGGREIRYLLLTAHYREQFNFTLDGLKSARVALGRLNDFLLRLSDLAGTEIASPEVSLPAQVSEALDADLNVSAAWGAVFEWMTEKNRLMASNQFSPAQASAALAAWRLVDAIFAIHRPSADEIPPAVSQLLDDRNAARKSRDFKKADALRDELKSKGWIIEDTSKGPRLKRV